MSRHQKQHFLIHKLCSLSFAFKKNNKKLTTLVMLQSRSTKCSFFQCSFSWMLQIVALLENKCFLKILQLKTNCPLGFPYIFAEFILSSTLKSLPGLAAVTIVFHSRALTWFFFRLWLLHCHSFIKLWQVKTQATTAVCSFFHLTWWGL